MSGAAVTFPVLGLAVIRAQDGAAECERLTWFVDERDFSTSTSWALAHWPRVGMVLADAAGRSWKITRMVKGPIVGPFWGRVLRALVRQSVHRVEQDLIEIRPLSLEEVKTRACDAIQANPDDWRDDEVIAGEDGPPREEQDLLDELKKAVCQARSLPQMINALYGEDFDG